MRMALRRPMWRRQSIPLLLVLLMMLMLEVKAGTEDCKTPCGHNRVQICHFNGKEFQTLCIRQNSSLRRPKHASAEDYCGPCTTHKPFESTEELREAVARYVSYNHHDVELATSYGWPMNAWNVSLVTDFSDLFVRKTTIAEEELGDWDVSSATTMDRMFWHCPNFEGNGLWKWNTRHVQSMERMFFGATRFVGDIGQWDTRQVTNMMGVFWKAANFNQDVGMWDVSRVCDASRMFADATTFNQDLSMWKTSQMRDMSYMFMGATSFDQTNLADWDVSKVLTMERMLYRVPAYETSPSKQTALWTAWTHQWNQIGRPPDSINTEDVFSYPERQQQVVYMRGNRPQSGTTPTPSPVTNDTKADDNRHVTTSLSDDASPSLTSKCTLAGSTTTS